MKKSSEQPCTCVRADYVRGGYDRSECVYHSGWPWQRALDKILPPLIVFGVIALVIGAIVFVRVAAPCSVLDWMPVKDVPARCLGGGR